MASGDVTAPNFTNQLNPDLQHFEQYMTLKILSLLWESSVRRFTQCPQSWIRWWITNCRFINEVCIQKINLFISCLTAPLQLLIFGTVTLLNIYTCLCVCYFGCVWERECVKLQRVCELGWICGVLLLPQTNEMRMCVFSLPFLKANEVCVCVRVEVCVLNWTGFVLSYVQAVSLNDKVYWWLQWDHYLRGSPFIPQQSPRS